MPTQGRKICRILLILGMMLVFDSLPFASAQLNGVWEEAPTGSATNGGVSNTPGLGSVNVSLKAAPDGNIYAAWGEFMGPNWEIYVRRFNGAMWEEVGAGSASGGGISNTPGSSLSPSVGFDSSNRPYIAWSESDEIYVRRFNGSSWEEVGTGSASGGGISNTPGSSFRPSLGFAPNGTLYVAWREGLGFSLEIYVRRFNGAMWEEVGVGSASGGGISNLGLSAFTSDLAVAPNGTPYVTWSNIGTSEIYVRRFNGTMWEEVGVGSASGGGISNSSGLNSLYPSIIVTAAGVAHIAWTERVIGLNAEIYVRRFNGTTWEEAGLNAASAGGVSNTSPFSENPSLANAPDGSIYVAWGDGNGGLENIYVRRFDGGTWQEVGAGSASGSGFSASPSFAAVLPSITVSPSNIPYVAWSSNTSVSGGTANNEIHARRFAQLMPPTPTPTSTPTLTPTPTLGTLTATPASTIFDPTVTKTGILDPGILGLPSETITWIITLSNTSGVTGNNLVIEDTFQPELRIESATSTHGNISVNGQTVTVNIPVLNSGQSVEIRVTTTVIVSPANGLFANLATVTGNGISESATAIVNVPSGLPDTGYPP